MELSELKKKAFENRKSNKKLIQKLKKQKGKDVDQLFHEAHSKIFCEIDCLNCANCCKTTGPLFTNKTSIELLNTLTRSLLNLSRTT